MSNLISYLFETNAVKICEENKPFWYTSGKIGPYFINTHFIYGNEANANSLLDFINSNMEDRVGLPAKVLKLTLEQYDNNAIYKDVINQMKEFILANIDIAEVDYISGGERRDWFFSNIMAHFLNKPHITLFKDMDAFVSDSKFEMTKKAEDLAGKKVLHIADLITVASSYLKIWIPAIEKLGAKILWSAVLVDRMQGGESMLLEAGIKSIAMANIDATLFDTAMKMGLLTKAQHEMLLEFYKDPDGSMRNFLLEHPEFLENSLKGNDKDAGRAKICIDENIYNI